MKVARYLGPGSLAIEEMPVPTIADGEVLVKVRACGVCGTDVKTYVRGHPRIGPGSVLGHEVAGEVVESRHPRFSPGQRVALGPYAPCGRCAACRRGRFSLCSELGSAFAEPGGFAEYVKVPRRLADLVMFAIPETMSFELASLAEPLACCVHGLEALSMPQGASLLIVGDGPMGLMQASIAAAFGAGHVVVAGATTHRLEVAAELADATIDVNKTTLVEAARKHFPDGPDAVMVSVASQQALGEAMELVADGGAVNVFAGMPKGETFPLDLERVHYDEVRVVGTFGYGPDDFSRALELLVDRGAVLERLITDRVKLADVEEALQAASRQAGVKTLVVS